MGRYKLNIEYLGTNYHGWQIQPEEITVQSSLMKALDTIRINFDNFQGSGRTDAGVHARGQVAHFDSNAGMDLNKLRSSLNGVLAHDIVVTEIEEVSDSFHSRFDARYRTYHYYIATEYTAFDSLTRIHVRTILDFELMNEASKALLGSNNFGSFCRTATSTDNKVCEIFRATWIQESKAHLYRFEIIGNRFLHGMVRAIVGTLLEIGRGAREMENIDYLLKANDRKQAGPSVPAKGLILEEVGYTKWKVND